MTPTPAFSFSGYPPGGPWGRSANSLRVAKAGGGADAQLTWACVGCTLTAPARIYRNQNAPFTSYLELYNGGTGTTYTNSGAVSSPQNYFWTVE